MDHVSYWNRYLMARHTRALDLGIIFLAMALIFMLIGRTFDRRRIIYRAQDPEAFWQTVVWSCMLSLLCFGLDFYACCLNSTR